MYEKMFDLLEKMYIEMQDMQSNMATKQEIQEIRLNMATKQEMQEMQSNMATKQEMQDMQEGFQKIKQDIARLETKMDENHKALYDGYKQSIEGITELREKLDKLTDKVENQEIKLKVL